MQATFRADLPFKEAAELWLQSRTFNGGPRTRFVAPRTLRDFAQYIKALNGFFAGIPVNQIHLGNIRTYQEERSATCGPNKINQEVATLVRIMKRCGAWTPELDEHFEPLQQEVNDIPRALSPDEQALWLETAQKDPRWRLVYLYSVVAFHTTAHSQEMRGLRRASINLWQRVLTITAASAKNKHRIRTIPLTDEAMAALSELLDRAASIGSTLPDHFVFPFYERDHTFNPTKPMSEFGLRQMWNEVRDASGLKSFRVHDTRHTAITRLAEAGTPIQVIMSMAGHISARMSAHYTSISEQAKRHALTSAYGQVRKGPHRAGAIAVAALCAVVSYIDCLSGVLGA